MIKMRRKFERHCGNLSHRKLFLIATEGTKTEPAYFNLFNQMKEFSVFVRCLPRKHSAPSEILKCMKNYLGKEKDLLRTADEAWLVVDKDNWPDEQFNALYQWSEEKDNYHLALSNPKFEYWLLLHFEDGAKITSHCQFKERLAKHMPNYDKTINGQEMTIEKIHLAMERAKKRDNPPCEKWPQDSWQTTVYRLINNILQQEIKT